MDCPSTSGLKDVSILVTEPSPECPNGPSSSSKNRLHTDSVSTLVHVLVHRESEEYQTDFEDGGKSYHCGFEFCDLPYNNGKFIYNIKSL